MVFQQPNPFAMSIFKNVASPEAERLQGDHAERVEKALRGPRCGMKVKDKAEPKRALLSGGQQQRVHCRAMRRTRAAIGC